MHVYTKSVKADGSNQFASESAGCRTVALCLDQQGHVRRWSDEFHCNIFNPTSTSQKKVGNNCLQELQLSVPFQEKGRCISISEVESLLRQAANDKRVCGGGGLDHSPTTNDSSATIIATNTNNTTTTNVWSHMTTKSSLVSCLSSTWTREKESKEEGREGAGCLGGRQLRV